jgi:hypothetical protein
MRAEDASEVMKEEIENEFIAWARRMPLSRFSHDICWCPREFRSPGKKNKI